LSDLDGDLLVLSNGEVNLDRYRCAKCSRKPSNAIEILKGCTCGHRLFRLQLNNNSSVSKEKLSHKTNREMNRQDMGFLTIRERQVGIYDINVEKLLQPEMEEEESPVIAGNNGIYSIRLDSHRKKTISQQ
jgi:predicted  nucleic acid-binding Zn-ribbon protein